MRTATLLAALASASIVSARIVAVTVPKTIKPGDEFTAILRSNSANERVEDVAIAIGVMLNGEVDTGAGGGGGVQNPDPAAGEEEGLGDSQDTETFYLGPMNSNQNNKPVRVKMSVSPSLQRGNATLSASLFSLVGDDSVPTMTRFEVQIRLGRRTSTTYVDSRDQAGAGAGTGTGTTSGTGTKRIARYI